MDPYRILTRVSQMGLYPPLEKALIFAKTRAQSFLEKIAIGPTIGRPLRFYTEDRFIDLSTEEAVAKGLNQFEHWLCGVGVENLYIRGNGDMYGGACNVGGRIGNIYSAPFRFPTDWLVCDRKYCRCGADMFIPKAKYKDAKTYLHPYNSRRLSRRADFREDEDLKPVAVARAFAVGRKQVHWELGYRCNYACSYCAPHLHNKVDPLFNAETLVTAADHIFANFAKDKKVNFIISGGEPTLHPGLVALLKHVHSLGHKVSLHSNGSRKAEYYRQLLSYADLNLSVHFESCRISHIVAIAAEALSHAKENIASGHFELKLMVNLHDGDKIFELIGELLKLNSYFLYCGLSVVPIQPEGDKISYLEDYKPEIKKLFGYWNMKRLKSQPLHV